MLRNIKILFPLLFMFIAFSCKDVLTELPETQFSADKVITSEQGLDLVVNGLYDAYTEYDYKGTRERLFTNPHSGKFWSAQGSAKDAMILKILPINVHLNKTWAQMYRTINIANVIIDNLENTELELANKDRSLGYAHFIRGAVYFDLARYFSGVPLRTAPASASNLDAPKSSKEEVYALVISDFKKAMELLPADKADNGNTPERPLRYAANMYLAKVYMTLAGEDGGDPSLWAKAKEALEPVMGKYSLTPTFAELWRPDNENTSEAIFELNFSVVEGGNNFGTVNDYTPKGLMPANTFGRLRPNKETFKAHVERYGLNAANGEKFKEKKALDLDSSYADPRIAATYAYNTHPKSYGKPATQKIYPLNLNGKNGYTAIIKYIDPSYSPPSTNRNFIALRYADALLMMAEIQNELNGPEAAFQYVNEVLARARDIDGDGNGDTAQPADWDISSVPDKETFRKFMMQERFCELVGEGHEWFDVRRRGVEAFKSFVIDQHITTGNRDVEFPQDLPTIRTAMLLPIPADEINGNQLITIEDQNPGY